MNVKLHEVLTRRISRLNDEFAVRRQRGLDAEPFVRRARSLTAAWKTTRPDALP